MGLVQAAVASPAVAAGRTFLAGGLLLLAGFYQMSPLKQACLRQCRSPLDFLTRYWRGGPGGAFRMGLVHGFFCLGCCWAMMALLFVGGAMNLLSVAALALFVLIEKLAPAGRVLGWAGGVALILWGGATLLTAADPGIWVRALPVR
jgi:predicted metal-binding membrane protein